MPDLITDGLKDRSTRTYGTADRHDHFECMSTVNADAHSEDDCDGGFCHGSWIRFQPSRALADLRAFAVESAADVMTVCFTGLTRVHVVITDLMTEQAILERSRLWLPI